MNQPRFISPLVAIALAILAGCGSDDSAAAAGAPTQGAAPTEPTTPAGTQSAPASSTPPAALTPAITKATLKGRVPTQDEITVTKILAVAASRWGIVPAVVSVDVAGDGSFSLDLDVKVSYTLVFFAGDKAVGQLAAPRAEGATPSAKIWVTANTPVLDLGTLTFAKIPSTCSSYALQPEHNPWTLVDLDGDGVPDYVDADDDNDGIIDLQDDDANNDGIADDRGDLDFDDDGVIDILDDDIDGDGIPNAQDPDDDNDGTPDCDDDDDNGDGIPDAQEAWFHHDGGDASSGGTGGSGGNWHGQNSDGHRDHDGDRDDHRDGDHDGDRDNHHGRN